MAKVQYSKKVPNFDNFRQLDGDTLKLKSLDGDSFTLKDRDGTTLEFEGSDFERTQSVVTGGVIEHVELINSKGKVLYTFDGLSVDAELVYKAFSLNNDPLRIIHGLMAGDDTVIGNKKNDTLWGFGGNDRMYGGPGNDFLYGHSGNDWMTGGQGNDTFIFATGYDRDTITDFTLTSGAHDYIRMDYYLYKDIVYSEADGDVTLTLSTGDSLTLEGVTQAQIQGKTQYFDFY